MYCDQCKKKPASVHITKIINNNKTQLQLCEDCAKDQQLSFGISSTLGLHSLLSSFLDNDKMYFSEAKKCKNCNLSYDKFAETGKLGCSECYSDFEGKLEPLLRRVHGSNSHKGKVPRRMGGAIRVKKELEELREQLNRAIRNERYEDAANLRDRIKEIERKKIDKEEKK